MHSRWIWPWVGQPIPCCMRWPLREAGVKYDIGRIDELSRRVPCLCKVPPSSPYHLQDVHRTGGVHTILGELARLGPINTECKTVTGKTIGQNIAEWDVRADTSTAWAKAAQVAGACVPLVREGENLKMALKPVWLAPGDQRALTLWRLACAINRAAWPVAQALFTDGATVTLDIGKACSGALGVLELLKQLVATDQGAVRVELRILRGAPALVFWRFPSAEAVPRPIATLTQAKVRNWELGAAQFQCSHV